MTPLTPRRSCAEAHAEALAATAAGPGHRLLHLVTTVTEPGLQDPPEYREALDAASGSHSVTTVANTVFPSALYRDPGLDWSPGLPPVDLARLDGAARDLYDMYSFMLPGLVKAEASSGRGTYFGTMVSWPGKAPGGHNQLEARVRQLRLQRARVSTFLATDLVVEGAAELGHDGANAPDQDDAGVPGLQVYRSAETRTQSFPCLVHIDISVLDGRLHLLAVYRHWHLVRKAYGNLLGLAALQGFLAQQSGYEVGELVVHAGVANAELGAGAARGLADRLGAALSTVGRP